MRDPNRIDKFCDELKTIWHQVPDWRLSQFMNNLMIAWQNEKGYDAFYAEDEEFLAFALEYLNEITGDSNE